MKRGLLAYLTPLVAFSIAGVAAYYSIFGLSRLFAGASLAVIVMASVLEVGKLLGASLLHTYWKKLHWLFKLYLTTAVFALMIITSAGIYGYLSSAYKITSSKAEVMHKELAVIEMKRSRFNESREDLKLEKSQLVKTVGDLRVSLSNPHQVQYIDRESGELITTTSGSARRALQKELKQTVSDRDIASVKLEAVTDSIAKMDITVLNKEMSNEADRELGPLKYLSELTGKSMDIVINWLMLLIIFVFDPLAIVFILLTNMIWKRKEKPMKIKMSVPEGKEFNTPYPFTEEMKEAFKKANEANVEETDEEYDSEGNRIIPNSAERSPEKKKEARKVEKSEPVKPEAPEDKKTDDTEDVASKSSDIEPTKNEYIKTDTDRLNRKKSKLNRPGNKKNQPNQTDIKKWGKGYR